MLDWMHELIAIGLEDLFRADPSVTRVCRSSSSRPERIDDAVCRCARAIVYIRSEAHLTYVENLYPLPRIV